MEGTLCGKLYTVTESELNGVMGLEAAMPKPKWSHRFLSRIFPLALLTFDVILTGLLFISFAWLDSQSTAVALARCFAVMAVGNVFGLFIIGGYSYRTKMNSASFLSEHVVVSLVGGIISAFVVYGFVSFGAAPARSVFYLPLLLFPVVSMFYRIKLERVKQRRQSERAICIIGITPESVALALDILAGGSKHEVVFVDDDDHLKCDGLGELGLRTHSLMNFNAQNHCLNGKSLDHIIIAKPGNELSPALAKQLLRAHSINRRVVTLESYQLKEFKKVPMDMVSPSWAFGEGFRINSSLAYNRFKRIVDVVGALIGLLLTAPVLLATWILIKLTSKGPALFCQKRVGLHEREFTLYKFRSMKLGADKEGDYTSAKDPRVTKVGEFLRKSRIDEIPQLWNVLKGDMSIIGPRPEWNKLVREYEANVELYHFRHMIRPGITGWAQVNYPYGANLEDTINKLKYDLYYVRYYSFLLDVSIVVKTVYTMLFGRGR